MAYNISVVDSLLIPRSTGSSFTEEALSISGTGAISVAQTAGSASFVISGSTTPLSIKKANSVLGNAGTLDFADYIAVTVAGGEAEISVTGVVNTTSAQTIAGDKTFTDTVVINNLTVTGTTTQINTTELLVEDNIVAINTAGAPAVSTGFQMVRNGSDPDAFLIF